MSDGFLALNKPAGPTSFQMVAMARRLTGVKRVGHAGTLDPTAEGVLVLCLGGATRMTEYLMDGRKEYVARVVFGVETDSYDAAGSVVVRRDPSGVSRRLVEELLPRFTGAIQQVPPMYSALHHEGRRLYALAREGIEVDRAPREVSVYQIEITAWEPPTVTLRIECSKGTYVRSLAHDLGQALGCGAHIEHLIRTRVEPFSLGDCVTPAELERAVQGGWWEALLDPIDAPVIPLAAAIVDDEDSRMIQNGRLSSWESASGAPAPNPGDLCRAYDPDGRLIALLGYDSEAGAWHPDKVFAR